MSTIPSSHLLADALRPRASAGLFDCVAVVAGSLLIAACAQIAVPLSFTTVPITGQTFAVLLVAALLGPTRGVLAVAAYLAEGAMGLPFFAHGTGGWPWLVFADTSGYLWGFIPAAWLTGFLAGAGWDKRLGKAMAAMAIGTIVIFTCGAAVLGMRYGMQVAIWGGVAPFVPGALVKIALAAALLPSGWSVVSRFNSHRSSP